MLWLGATGFGGPVALVGYMHRDLIEGRRWVSEDEYKEGLALAQLSPGPLAAQLAIYLGYVRFGVLGATIAGVAFVIPSFLIVLALGWAYVRFEGLPWMQPVFYGVGAAVIGIIANSAYKLTRKTIGRDWLLWTIVIASAATTAITESENILLFLGAGVLVWLVRRPAKSPPLALTSVLLAWSPVGGTAAATTATSWPLLGTIGLYFLKAGAFVFGSGLAIVPFLYGGVVKEHEWLNDRQFMDAVAIAMITPGPVVITVAFIGYLVAGVPGACVAAVATFVPCWLCTVIPAPYFHKYGKQPGIAAFVNGVTAAAIGAICGAVYVLGSRSLTDIFTVAVAIAALATLLKFKKVPEPLIVLASAIAGLLAYGAG
jgi:chromate transporter